MSEYFKHAYTIPSEERPDGTVLCMRCAKPIKTEQVRQKKGFNTNRMVDVTASIAHSDYRQMPVMIDYMGKPAMTHLPVCADCFVVQLKPEDLPLIHSQIVQACETSLRWGKHPEEAIIAMKERWANSRIVCRPLGRELVNAYKKSGGN